MSNLGHKAKQVENHRFKFLKKKLKDNTHEAEKFKLQINPVCILNRYKSDTKMLYKKAKDNYL